MPRIIPHTLTKYYSMKTKQKEIGALIQETVFALRSKNYSDSTIVTKKRVWASGICKYMQSHGLHIYSSVIGTQFLESVKLTVSYNSYKHYSDSIYSLNQILETGNVSRTNTQHKQYLLTGDLGKLALSFLESQKELRKKDLTIEKHRRVLFHFINQVSLQCGNSVNSLTEKAVVNFLSAEETPSTKERDINTLSLFFQYLYDSGKVNKSFEYLFKNRNSRHNSKLPSYYTKEEIAKACKTINTANDVGKRDYAIFLLASRYGLRASDISNLTFQQIDWERNIITIRQYKTQNVLELPLLKDVGEAIISYIKYARPIVDDDSIFQTASAPYRKINSLAISKMVSRAFIHAGIPVDGRKSGSHALRHSLAINLLDNGYPLQLITEILGHRSCESTLNYIRVDIKGLSSYCLDVPPVDTNFYNQPSFYE